MYLITRKKRITKTGKDPNRSTFRRNNYQSPFDYLTYINYWKN